MKYTCILSLLSFHFIEAQISDRFPDGFLIGFATSSYQIEGAWNEGGKAENIWDRLVHSRPSLVSDGTNGDVACDSYHKFEDDIRILKKIGADVYRFSLSWSRILPKGDVSEINKEGVQYYNNLINRLLENKIQPMITLYHWDLPQPLQDLGGWPNPIMVDYFEDYARLAFHLFGDRVKWWITFNEPLETCANGYGNHDTAPALGMTGIADYLCAHTIIKSHARAYHIYDEEFRPIQKGNISITLNGVWCDPLTDSKLDKEAAEVALEFEMGWFLHPLLKGDYPPIMRKNVDANSVSENRQRSRLPHFSHYWKAYIKGTLDFVAINHYTTVLVTPGNNDSKSSYNHDRNVTFSQNSSWPGAAVPWLRIEPTGFQNGYADKGELDDQTRINYHRLYLKELLKAIYEDNVNVIGYIVWSIIDNFEWLSGYSAKFGVYYVDFDDSRRPRTPKASAAFFRDMLRTKKLPSTKFFLQTLTK